MKSEFKERILHIPELPGVYLMKDAIGDVIYVGKAFNLKKRISSYFEHKNHRDLKAAILIEKIAAFETIVTSTEQEALILEATLIRQHKPRYNVILKDDKRYPSLRLDIHNDYPTIQLVRKIKPDGSLYFGPYASAVAVRQTLKFIHKTFNLRKCKSPVIPFRSRPCLNYQMGVCLAPCSREVDKQKYADMVNEVRLFLEGRTQSLIKKIKIEMMDAAENEEFERAAHLRDKLFSFEKIFEKQVAVTTDFVDRDVIGIARDSHNGIVIVLFVREGLLQGIYQYPFKDTISNNSEIIRAFLRQFYESPHYVPDEIIIPINIDDAGVYEKWLTGVRGKKIKIITSHRGAKASLLHLASKNAETRLMELAHEEKTKNDFLLKIQKGLKLSRYPRRIECFDNSGISGKHLVAGQVVFINGKPDKSSYRRYNIKTVHIQDDYACMEEVLTRRFSRDISSDAFPDLLMVDGGKGQLNIAVNVLKELELDHRLDVIGIAKSEKKDGRNPDKIYKPGRVNPINLTGKGELLLFLQQIRDEAHRYSVAFHRKKRTEASLQSCLDHIPGIGRKRKTMLLKKFSSLKNIQEASSDELSKLPGMNMTLADQLLRSLSTLTS